MIKHFLETCIHCRVGRPHCHARRFSYTETLYKKLSQKQVSRWRMESKSVQRNYRHRQQFSWKKLLSFARKEFVIMIKNALRWFRRRSFFLFRKSARLLCCSSKSRRKLAIMRKQNRMASEKVIGDRVATGQLDAQRVNEPPPFSTEQKVSFGEKCETPLDQQGVSLATKAFITDAWDGGQSKNSKVFQPSTGTGSPINEQIQRENCFQANSTTSTETAAGIRNQLENLTQRGIVKNVRLATLAPDSIRSPEDRVIPPKTSPFIKRPIVNTFAKTPLQGAHRKQSELSRPLIPVHAPSALESQSTKHPGGLLDNHLHLMKNIKVTPLASQEKKA